MKKILGIIVLGLLLQGCASGVSTNVQDELINQSTISVGMSYSELKKFSGSNQLTHETLNNSKQFITVAHKLYPTWRTFYYSGNIFLLEQKNKSKQLGSVLSVTLQKNLDNYKIIKIYKDKEEEHLDFYNYILQIPNISPEDRNDYLTAKSYKIKRIAEFKKAKTSEAERKKAKTEKTKNELLEMINKAKSTCKTLGFEEGTGKFTDCTLKLYSQEVDNIVALKVAEQKVSSSSSSGTMTIYDPVRDRQNQIDRGMKMLGGGCTLGIDC